LTELLSILVMFLTSLNERMKKEKCPLCGKPLRIDYLKTGCCHRLIPPKKS